MIVLVMLAACAPRQTILQGTDAQVEIGRLHDIQRWSFDGRIAVRSRDDSWTASLHWQHQPGIDNLKLSGPLGQGGVSIVLDHGCITIDQGGQDQAYSCEPDELIQQRLGRFVPVEDLSSWVLGVPQPTKVFEDTADGFIQSGWEIRIKELMQVGAEFMPHKMIVSKDTNKLKLVIDRWVVNE